MGVPGMCIYCKQLGSINEGRFHTPDSPQGDCEEKALSDIRKYMDEHNVKFTRKLVQEFFDLNGQEDLKLINYFIKQGKVEIVDVDSSMLREIKKLELTEEFAKNYRLDKSYNNQSLASTSESQQTTDNNSNIGYRSDISRWRR